MDRHTNDLKSKLSLQACSKRTSINHSQHPGVTQPSSQPTVHSVFFFFFFLLVNIFLLTSHYTTQE